MNISGENLLVFAIVALAVGYLMRRVWGMIAGRRQAGCGACANCPSEAAGIEPQVLSVESLLEPVRRAKG